MAASQTKTVEFDSELLERLHQRRPEMSDRELLESMARITLGRETLRRVQERNTLSENEAIELGVKAVQKLARAPIAAPRRAEMNGIRKSMAPNPYFRQVFLIADHDFRSRAFVTMHSLPWDEHQSDAKMDGQVRY